MKFILDYFEWVNIDREPVIRSYATIDAHTRKQGRVMGKNDLWIAASARATGARVLTTDGDFDLIHGIFIQRERVLLANPPAAGP
jgi:tRNA(fMet)-specific endonuclease VapC